MQWYDTFTLWKNWQFATISFIDKLIEIEKYIIFGIRGPYNISHVFYKKKSVPKWKCIISRYTVSVCPTERVTTEWRHWHSRVTCVTCVPCVTCITCDICNVCSCNVVACGCDNNVISGRKPFRINFHPFKP